MSVHVDGTNFGETTQGCASKVPNSYLAWVNPRRLAISAATFSDQSSPVFGRLNLQMDRPRLGWWNQNLYFVPNCSMLSAASVGTSIISKIGKSDCIHTGSRASSRPDDEPSRRTDGTDGAKGNRTPYPFVKRIMRRKLVVLARLGVGGFPPNLLGFNAFWQTAWASPCRAGFEPPRAVRTPGALASLRCPILRVSKRIIPNFRIRQSFLPQRRIILGSGLEHGHEQWPTSGRRRRARLGRASALWRGGRRSVQHCGDHLGCSRATNDRWHSARRGLHDARQIAPADSFL